MYIWRPSAMLFSVSGGYGDPSCLRTAHMDILSQLANWAFWPSSNVGIGQLSSCCVWILKFLHNLHCLNILTDQLLTRLVRFETRSYNFCSNCFVSNGETSNIYLFLWQSSSIVAFNAEIKSFSAISSSCDKVTSSETQDSTVSAMIFSNNDPAKSV